MFGLVKIGKSEETNADNCNMEIFCFQWNFPEFLFIYEEVAQLGEVQSVGCKLESYFSKVPSYYAPYFLQYFKARNLNEFYMKKWRFFTHNELNLFTLNQNKKISEEIRLNKQVCSYNYFSLFKVNYHFKRFWKN